MDHISYLPDFLIHQIMSYLTEKEVARTNVLSKRWNYLRTSFPDLDFCESYEHFVGEDLAFKEPDEFNLIEMFRLIRGISRFVNYADDFLLRFSKLKFSMLRFRIWMSFLDYLLLTPFLDKWIELIVSSEVKEIDFNFQLENYVTYTMPSRIFSAKSAITLSLGGCKLEHPSDSIRLHSLKCATLTKVCINGETLQMLTSQCLLLEELYLSDCWGFERILVAQASKLKIFHICDSPDELERVEIAVSSLQEFVLTSGHSEEPIVIEMAGCLNLKVLQLSGFAFKAHEFHRLISKFSLLENLAIDDCQLLEQIKISSNLLKNLDITSCSDVKAIDVDTPNLRSFYFVSPPIFESSINAPCPWRVGFMDEVDLHNQWHLNARKFLGVSNQIQELAIRISSNRNSFSLDEFRKSSDSPPCEVDNLYLQSYKTIPPSTVAAVLEGTLEICYPRLITLPKALEPDYIIKWLNEQMMNTNCCASLDIKCWRHYLKDFEFETIDPDEDVMSLEDDSSLEYDSEAVCLDIDWCFPASVEKV